MLLKKLSQPTEHKSASEYPGALSCRVRSLFHLSGVQADLNAALKVFTDESNNDRVVDSKQSCLFTAPKRKKLLVKDPFHYLGYIRHGFSPSQTSFLIAREMHLRFSGMSSRPNPDWVMQATQRIAAFCGSITYYGASQFTNPGNCPTWIEVNREGAPVSPYRIRGHGTVLHSMYTADKSKHNHQYRKFLELVGPNGLRLIDALTFREVRSSSMEYHVRVGGKLERRKRENKLVIPQFRIGRQILSPNQLSEGTFKTLVLLFHLITEKSSALLIEEPEVCVHHGLLASILEIIRSSSIRKQIILSTHSDFVLDHVRPENVIAVKFDGSLGTVAHSIQKTMNRKELSALRDYLETTGNLGDFWREGGLGDRP
jgi:hypothetical protein